MTGSSQSGAEPNPAWDQPPAEPGRGYDPQDPIPSPEATASAATGRQVRSWALWDWATQPFNSVILTFVWAPLFLISTNLLPDDIAALPAGDPLLDRALADLSANYGLVSTLAGVAIFLLAPVLGQRADTAGHKKRGLLIATAGLALIQFALFFVQADPAFFWYGAIMLAFGAVVSEIAGVNYNAMLVQVSDRHTVGKVSGLGWGLGYIGGILALVIVVVLTQLDWFGMDTSNGMAYRLIAVGCAVWTVVFSIPLFRNVPEAPARTDRQTVGFLASYGVLVKDVVALFRNHRSTFWFLIASAVYRDGLAGVFAFGGVLAAVSFGFSPTEVMIFGIALNLVAGLSTIFAGRLDDRFGPRAVIVTALCLLVGSCLFVFAFHDGGKLIFWIGGMILSAAVGPAQAASRSLLARVTPVGMQGEIFGLYATTGRVVSFLSPALWTLFITLGGATYWGIVGITIVLALGLALLLLVRLPKYVRPARQ